MEDSRVSKREFVWSGRGLLCMIAFVRILYVRRYFCTEASKCSFCVSFVELPVLGEQSRDTIDDVTRDGTCTLLSGRRYVKI